MKKSREVKRVPSWRDKNKTPVDAPDIKGELNGHVRLQRVAFGVWWSVIAIRRILRIADHTAQVTRHLCT